MGISRIWLSPVTVARGRCRAHSDARHGAQCGQRSRACRRDRQGGAGGRCHSAAADTGLADRDPRRAQCRSSARGAARLQLCDTAGAGYRRIFGERRSGNDVCAFNRSTARCQRRQQQLGGGARKVGFGPTDSGQRSAPCVLHTRIALRRASAGSRIGRDRRGRTGTARHLIRPQRYRRLRFHHFFCGSGRPVRLRIASRRSNPVSLWRRMGKISCHDREHFGARRHVATGGADVYTAWPGGIRRSNDANGQAAARFRGTHRVARAGNRALYDEPCGDARDKLRRVSYGHGGVGYAGRKSGLCRYFRDHWLGCRSARAAASELGRIVAGSRRWTLRVEWFSGYRRVAVVARSCQWFHRNSQRIQSAAGLSGGRAQAGFRVAFGRAPLPDYGGVGRARKDFT